MMEKDGGVACGCYACEGLRLTGWIGSAAADTDAGDGDDDDDEGVLCAASCEEEMDGATVMATVG